MKKVIIWGHKNPINTFYYVNFGFYKAFKMMGYDIYWFDNNDNVSNMNFSDSLFLSEGTLSSLGII